MLFQLICYKCFSSFKYFADVCFLFVCPFTITVTSLIDYLFVLLIYLNFNALKCNLTDLTTKIACIPLEVSSVDTHAHVSEFHVLVDCNVAYVQKAFPLCFIVWQLIAQAVLLPPPFPSSFHCFYSVTGACSSCCMGAHGWVTRIC